MTHDDLSGMAFTWKHTDLNQILNLNISHTHPKTDGKCVDLKVDKCTESNTQTLKPDLHPHTALLSYLVGCDAVPHYEFSILRGTDTQPGTVTLIVIDSRGRQRKEDTRKVFATNSAEN